MNKKLIAAIDLSAMNTKVAIPNFEDWSLPILRDENGNDTFPSAHYDDGTTVAYGAQALAMGELNPEDLTRGWKPHIADESMKFGKSRPKTAREMAVGFLRNINSVIESTYGQKATESAFSFQSMSSDETRKVLCAIYAEAGMPVIPEGKGGIGCIPESLGPVLSVEYKQNKNADLSNLEQRLAVISDIGNSSTDNAIVLVSGNQIRTLRDGGDVKLGGRDLNEMMLDFVMALSIERGLCRAKDWDKYKNVPAIRFEIDKRIEDAKKALATAAEFPIPIPLGAVGTLKIKREKVEQKVFKPFAEKVLSLLKQLLAEAAPAIAQSGCVPKDIIMTGGTCRNAFLRRYIADGVGLTVLPGTDAMFENVMGVALHGLTLYKQRQSAGGIGWLPPGARKLKLVSAFDIGAIVVTDRSRPDHCVSSVIIPRGQSIPNSVSKTYSLLEDNQKAVHMRIVQCAGDGQPESACHLLGETEFTNLPAGPGADRLDVTVTYDSAALVTVEIVERLSGQRRVIEIKIDAQSQAA